MSVDFHAECFLGLGAKVTVLQWVEPIARISGGGALRKVHVAPSLSEDFVIIHFPLTIIMKTIDPM